MRVRTGAAATVLAGLVACLLAAPSYGLGQPGIPVTMMNLNNTCALTANFTSAALGRALEFTNNTEAKQTVTEQEGFWKFSVSNGGLVGRSMTHAGDYKLSCDAGVAYMDDPVALSAPSSSSGAFTVQWATSKAASSYTYTVQYKITSSGSIKTWKKGTVSRSATFNPKHFNTYYYFRAETIRTSTAKSGWSPWKKIHVS